MSAPTLDVDLSALAANLRAVRARVAPAELILVVKDDAYGLGLPAILSRALHEGVRWFGVSDLDTALAVRSLAGARPRILAWPAGDSTSIPAAIAASIDLGVGDPALLEAIASAPRETDAPPRVHLKIDTGLRRNGFRPEEWDGAVARARELERAGRIAVVGAWSHIAEASDAEDDAARAVFDRAVGTLEDAGCRIELRHLAASAAAFARPEFRYDAVRIGAFCYGVRSAEGPSSRSLGLHAVAALRATVTRVTGDEVVAGLGSLDGVPSILGGRVTVGTPGGARPLLRVGENELLVASWSGAAIGDTITVFGPGEQGESSATTLGEAIGTIGEEVLLRVSPLIARRYVDDGPSTLAEPAH